KGYPAVSVLTLLGVLLPIGAARADASGPGGRFYARLRQAEERLQASGSHRPATRAKSNPTQSVASHQDPFTRPASHPGAPSISVKPKAAHASHVAVHPHPARSVAKRLV